MDIEIIAEVNKVSERIQKLRTERRMSQMDLAVEAGISQGFLAMMRTAHICLSLRNPHRKVQRDDSHR